MTRKILADKSLKCKRDAAKKFPKNPILSRQQSQLTLLVDRTNKLINVLQIYS
jgi:hypothetical protein